MLVFPVLHTPRLILRQLSIDDVPALVKYANNKKIADQILNKPYPYQEFNAVFRLSYVVQGFKTRERFVFAVVLKEPEELVGEISLHLTADKKMAELGYWLGEPFWNRGIASEAAARILEFGFEKLGLELVFATCHVDNPASEKVLIRSGMSRHETRGNVMQYRLTREQFAERAKSTR